MTVDMRDTIAQAICDALNDQLDDGYELFGDGVDYDTLDISVGKDGVIVIEGLGPGMRVYVVQVGTVA